MGSKSKTGLAAVSFTVVGFLFVFIAFVAPYWLETDGELTNPKFQRLGLWQVCVHQFGDTRHWYEGKLSGCWWVFEEEFYIIHDILLPGFFVATQFFFTLSFTLLLVASLLMVLYACCSREHERYVLLLLAIGSDLVISATNGLIAVIIFGARGDGRDWMPDWEHNNMSWGFALAVLGSLALFIAGVLFLSEARVHRIRRLKEDSRRGELNMGPVKGHTTI